MVRAGRTAGKCALPLYWDHAGTFPSVYMRRAVRLPVISGPFPRWALALVVQVGVSVWLSPESAWELWPWEGPKQTGAFFSPSPRGAEDKGLRMVFSATAVFPACPLQSALPHLPQCIQSQGLLAWCCLQVL